MNKLSLIIFALINLNSGFKNRIIPSITKSENYTYRVTFNLYIGVVGHYICGGIFLTERYVLGTKVAIYADTIVIGKELGSQYLHEIDKTYLSQDYYGSKSILKDMALSKLKNSVQLHLYGITLPQLLKTMKEEPCKVRAFDEIIEVPYEKSVILMNFNHCSEKVKDCTQTAESLQENWVCVDEPQGLQWFASRGSIATVRKNVLLGLVTSMSKGTGCPNIVSNIGMYQAFIYYHVKSVDWID